MFLDNSTAVWNINILTQNYLQIYSAFVNFFTDPVPEYITSTIIDINNFTNTTYQFPNLAYIQNELNNISMTDALQAMSGEILGLDNQVTNLSGELVSVANQITNQINTQILNLSNQISNLLNQLNDLSSDVEELYEYEYSNMLNDLSNLYNQFLSLLAQTNALTEYDIHGGFTGLGTTSQVVIDYVFTQAVEFSSNLAGSYGIALTPPQSLTTYNVTTNGFPVGTITFNPGSTSPIFYTTYSNSLVLNPGESLQVIGPATPDPVMKNVFITLVGYITIPNFASSVTDEFNNLTSQIGNLFFYDIAGGFNGTGIPNQVILERVFTRPVDFAQNLSGSYGIALTPSSSTVNYSIDLNGTLYGMLTFLPGSTTPVISQVNPFTTNPGDVLQIIGPATPDSSLSNVYITLSGTLDATDILTPLNYQLDGLFDSANNLNFYDISGSVINAYPNQIVADYTFTRPVTFPQNFAGSYGVVLNPPLFPVSYNIIENNLPIGTMTINPNSNYVEFSSIKPFTITENQTLKVVGPPTFNSTALGVFFTLVGNLVIPDLTDPFSSQINNITNQINNITSELTNLSFYDIPGGFGGIGTPNQVILNHEFTQFGVFPQNFVGSYGLALTSSTSNVTYTIFANNSSVGSMIFNSGSQSPVFSTTSMLILSPDESLQIIGPASPDGQLSNVFITITGTMIPNNTTSIIYGQIDTLDYVMNVLTNQVNNLSFFDIPGGFNGTGIPNQTILNFITAQPITFPEGLVGSYGIAMVSPQSNVSYTVLGNGTPFGSVTFVPGSDIPEFSAPSSFTLNPGQTLKVIGPSNPDPQLSTVYITLTGNLNL